MSKADKAMGDIDTMASEPQVPGVYKPGTARNDVLAGKDIDADHGGINSTRDVPQINDVVGTHASTAPTPKDLGIS